jgi:hypothetical protein
VRLTSAVKNGKNSVVPLSASPTILKSLTEFAETPPSYLGTCKSRQFC